MENLGTEKSILDVEENLSLLEVYNYLKVNRKATKGKDSNKPISIQSQQDKITLRDYLENIPAFQNFFLQSTTNITD